ncbi:Emopamil-binding protein [Martensiomyces pterosporus]|nr:Emopamil-binding protein [Martensiomyces pterosporus]
MSANTTAPVTHPYFPRDHPIPHYVPSQLNMAEALATVGGSVAVLIVISGILVGRARTPLSCKDKFVVAWMLVCAGIHIVLEGYFVFNNKSLAGMQTVMADLWREYSHSDSRYLTSDPFTVIMEGITAVFDGPLAIVTAYGILADSPIRYAAQLVTSLAQLYGNVLYMGTNCIEGFRYSNPAPKYFYGYFVLMNLPWIIIPTYLCIDATNKIYRGMLIAQRATTVKKSN